MQQQLAGTPKEPRAFLARLSSVTEGLKLVPALSAPAALAPSRGRIASLDDLSGETMDVRKSSSYYASLTALNDRFRQAGKPEAKLVLVPDALEDEDMLEMMNAGLLELIVVDDWKARMWAQVLPKLKVRADIELRPPTKRGWAIRKDNPKLAAELNDFYANWAKKVGVIPHRQQQYMKMIKALHSASGAKDQQRFTDLIAYFRSMARSTTLTP